MGANKEYYIAIQDQLFNTAHQVENGELSHLDGLIKMRQHKKNLEESLDIINDFEKNNLQEIEREASKYPAGYDGYKISVTSGRRMYSFKGIKEIEDIDTTKKQLEDKYRSAFDGFQKGIVQTTRLDENDPDSPLGWVDEFGQVLPFPELNYGKSFITIRNLNHK